MQRKALVVGVSQYSKLRSLESFANNANAIADILEPTFKVKRLPEVVEGDRVCVGKGKDKGTMPCDRLQSEIRDLFTATDLDTVLLYFSGHGVRGRQYYPKTYLATSETEVLDDGYRKAIEIDLLKQFLRDCPAREQIVWLDCCYGGDLADFRDICDRNDGKTRFIITASRSQDPAYQEIAGEMGVFTRVLVEALARTGTMARRITCAAIEDAVREELQSSQYPQMPQFYRTPNRTIEFWHRQAKPVNRELSIKEQINALETEINSITNIWQISDDKQRPQLIEEFNKKLSSKKTLEQSLKNPNLNEKKFSKIDLAKIDFKTARSQIAEPFRMLETQGGFLSLIVENCENFKGDLFIEEIRYSLTKGENSPKQIIIKPQPSSTDYCHDFWMKAIADHFGVKVYRNNINPEILVDKIIPSCKPGRTFFFELQNWGDLEDSAEVLNDFYDRFWMLLIKRQKQILNSKVRFVSVVSDDGLLDEKCFEFSCTTIKLELGNWTHQEINDWLNDYAGLESDKEVLKEANNIFRKTLNGLPSFVCKEIIQRFY
jgi:uncharacterized caspase-like protein